MSARLMNDSALNAVVCYCIYKYACNWNVCFAVDRITSLISTSRSCSLDEPFQSARGLASRFSKRRLDVSVRIGAVHSYYYSSLSRSRINESKLGEPPPPQLGADEVLNTRAFLIFLDVSYGLSSWLLAEVPYCNIGQYTGWGLSPKVQPKELFHVHGQ